MAFETLLLLVESFPKRGAPEKFTVFSAILYENAAQSYKSVTNTEADSGPTSREILADFFPRCVEAMLFLSTLLCKTLITIETGGQYNGFIA